MTRDPIDSGRQCVVNDFAAFAAKSQMFWSATGAFTALDLDIRHYDVLEAMEDGPLDAPQRICAGSCVNELCALFGDYSTYPSYVDREGGAR